MESFFEKNQRKLFLGLFALSLLCSFLLFDLRMSLGGDDSVYITRGWDLLQEGKFPTFQGPLYPMVLSLIMMIAGVKVGLLKVFSMGFLAAHFYFFYKAFKHRVDQRILWPVLGVLAVNGFIHYYGSQTYTEAFFMMLQMIFFWFFFDRFLAKDTATSEGEKESGWKKEFFKFLGLGGLLLALGLTRSIGFAAVFAVVAYFLLFRQWKNAGFTVVAFLLLYGGFKLFSGMIWETPGVQFGDQAAMFTWVDPYNQSLGKETFSGFTMRFVDNSNLYLSKHLPRIVGLRTQVADTVQSLLTILVYLLFLLSFLLAFRKNKAMVFTGLYIGATCGMSFVLLQAYWDSDRLILPFVPLIILFILYGLKELFEKPQLQKARAAVVGIGLVLVVSSGIGMASRAAEHVPVLKASLAGDNTFGFEVWRVNYLDVCQFAASNLPGNAVVAARKPSMAFLHSGKTFTGIRKVPSLTPQEMFDPAKAYLLVKTLDVFPKFQEYYFANLKGVILGYGPLSDQFPQNVSYQVYEFTPGEIAQVQENIKQVPFPYTLDVNGFLQSFESVACIDPEVLVGIVNDKAIDYIVYDQLRLDGTNVTIVMYKFMSALSSKYPDAFEEVYVAGNTQFERSILYKVNRDRLKPPTQGL